MHKFLESHIQGVGYDDLTPIGCEAKPMAEKIIWRQAKGITSRFYWLQIPEKHLVNGQRMEATIDGQTINITAEKTPRLVVRLSDQLLSLDKPVMITVNGEEKFSGKVKRSAREIIKSLEQRGDLASIATATVTVKL